MVEEHLRATWIHVRFAVEKWRRQLQQEVAAEAVVEAAVEAVVDKRNKITRTASPFA